VEPSTSNNHITAGSGDTPQSDACAAAVMLLGGLILAGIAVIGYRAVLTAFHRGWEQGHAAGVEEGRATYPEAGQ
jgi:hypothetical protein